MLAGRARLGRHAARRRQLRCPGAPGLGGGQRRERRRSRLGARERRSCPDLRDQIAACRSVRSPTRSSARRACTSSRSATSGPARPAVPADRDGGSRQRSSRQQLERQASRYLRDLRRDAFIDVRHLTRWPAAAAGLRAQGCGPTSGWASISCSTRRSCAGSPPRRAISPRRPCSRSAPARAA